MTDVVTTTATPVVQSRVRDFIALMKPRVMSLVVFTGFVGYFLAPSSLHPLLAVMAILCLSFGAGAAAAVNMWYERDLDALMRRTAGRPVPAGRVSPDDALVFGIFLSLGSVSLMGLVSNWTAAGLLAVSILFYVTIYTFWLKRRTPQNIVIGGAAGALPPVIGWAAATGEVALAPILMFLMIFFWTPPHFWALALFRNEDYQRAGLPMLPITAGRLVAKRYMLAYTLVLFPLAVAPWVFGMAGWIYGFSAIVLGALFILSAVQVLREPDAAGDKAARRMFGFSILYLFMIFAMLIVDRVSIGSPWQA